MVRTHITADRLMPRTNNAATDVAELTDDIESFGDPEVTISFIDATEEAECLQNRI